MSHEREHVISHETKVGRDIEAAIERARFRYQTDDIKIDNDTKLSETDDGTWVQAWVWLPDEEEE